MTKQFLLVLMILSTFSMNSMDVVSIEQPDVDAFFNELLSDNPTLETLERYLKQGIPVNREKYIDECDELRSPLEIACRRGHLGVCRFLIDRGANIHSKTSQNTTLLHFAARYGHHKVCHLLVGEGLNVNAQTLGGITPLHYAVWSGDIETCKTLLENGAELGHAFGEYSMTSLSIAAELGSLDICKFLFTRHYSSDAFLVKYLSPNNAKHGVIFNAILRAIQFAQRDTFTFLVNKSNLHRYKYEALLTIAAAYGHVDFCKLLVEKGACVSTKLACDGNRTALHNAAENNHVDVCRFLIVQGADIDAVASVGTPLQIAGSAGNDEVCELLRACHASRGLAVRAFQYGVATITAVAALAIFLL